MESIIHKIYSLYNQLGPGEKKIADYILKHPHDILGTSISDLANNCGCGDATVVRFSRRLGFEGYQGLKIGIASQIGDTSGIALEITKDDSCFNIFQKRINDISVALQNTEAVLDKAELQKAAEVVMKAGRIIIFGLGNSAAVARDAAHKFLRLGLNSQSCSDNHLQAIIASHLSPRDVAIGISHSGSSKDIIDALRLAKMSGATTICITNHGNPPILKESDIKLFTKAEETQRSILAMSSRIAQLAIFDTIYTYIVVNADKAAIEAIYNTETALQNKKS